MHNGHQTRDQVYLNLDGKLNRQGSYHQYKQEYLGKIAKNQPTTHANTRQQSQIQRKSRQEQDRNRMPRNSQNQYKRTAFYDQTNKTIDVNKQQKRLYNQGVNSPQRSRYSRGNRYSNQNILNSQVNCLYGHSQDHQDKQQTKHNHFRKYDQNSNKQGSKPIHYRKYDQNIGQSASIRQLDRPNRLSNHESQHNEKFYKRNEVSYQDHNRIPDKYQTQNQARIQNNYDDTQGIVYSHHNTPIRAQKNSKLSITPDSVAKSKQRRQNLISRSIQLKQRMNELSGQSVPKKAHKEITNSEFDAKYNSEKVDSEINLKVDTEVESQRRLERLRGQPQERFVDSPYRQQQSGLRSYKRYSREILEDNQHEGKETYQNQARKIDLFTKEIVKPCKDHKSQEQYHQKYPLRSQKRGIGREDKKEPEREQRRYGQREEKREPERSRQQKVNIQQGDCMSRITMLNKKINERINSIINNFGSPS